MRRNASIWLVILSTVGLSGFLLLRKKSKNSVSSFDYWDFSPYKELKKYILAQARVESANFTSPLYKRSFNAFGMKNAIYRFQYGYSVPGDPYRHYANLLESIQDFEAYLKSQGYPVTVSSVEAYAGNLKRLGYFEAPLGDYITALKSWL